MKHRVQFTFVKEVQWDAQREGINHRYIKINENNFNLISEIFNYIYTKKDVNIVISNKKCFGKMFWDNIKSSNIKNTFVLFVIWLKKIKSSIAHIFCH